MTKIGFMKRKFASMLPLSMENSGVPDVSENKLKNLLNLKSESWFLDYKSSVNLKLPDETKELAKDVAAFSDKGGWILIGVANDGEVIGVPQDAIKLFDEATLRPKLLKYLPKGIELHTSSHLVSNELFEEKTVVIVHILPHFNGACVFNESVQKSNNDTIARKGDIFTRNGSSSERIAQEDMERILNKRARLTSDREQAARHSRVGALQVKTPPNVADKFGKPLIQMGWATSQRPMDLTSRIFYEADGSFGKFFESTLENKYLRRDGQTFDNFEQLEFNCIRRFGSITGGWSADSYIVVQVHSDGWISVTAWQAAAERNLNEVFGWVLGACQVAHRLIRRLDLGGVLYTTFRLPLVNPVFDRVKTVEASLETPHESWSQSGFLAAAQSEMDQIINRLSMGVLLPEDWPPRNVSHG